MSITTILPRVHIGEVIRKAIVFSPVNVQGDSMDSDPLVETVARFFSILGDRQIEYVLVGGIALLQYIEGRNTEDIDLIMTRASLKQIPEIVVETEDADLARAKFDDLRVDLLLTTNPLFEEVRRHHTTLQRFVEQEIPCATVEGLILFKLYALPSLYRQGNFARVGLYENDIATLIHDYDPPLERLFAQLAPHLSDSDLAQVKGIVAELQQRIRRFSEGFTDGE
ncbi:MAG: hypothetical protein M3R52_10025 [Acidobacteriota bacterium]|nr:hypothetical protein [Acidobacteriota bacterium]